MPHDEKTASGATYGLEIIGRERRADGVVQLQRSTSVRESARELLVAPGGATIGLWIGPKPGVGEPRFSGGLIDLTPAEAAHVAGLLLAASAEARG